MNTLAFDSILLPIGEAMIASFWWIAAIGLIAGAARQLTRSAAARHTILAGALLVIPFAFTAALSGGGRPTAKLSSLVAGLENTETLSGATPNNPDWARYAAIA